MSDDQVYHILNLKIHNALVNNKKIGICPLGKNGLLAKILLQERYGQNSYLLVDNAMCNWNKNVINIDELSECKDKDTIFLITVENSVIRDKLSSQILNKGYDIDVLDFPSVYPTQDQNYLEELFGFLTPKKVIGYSLKRFGSSNDGGYCIVDDFDGINKAYSFGIAEDVSWDKDIASRDVEIYMFDPSIDRLPEENDRFHFYRIGVGSKRLGANYLPVDEILKMNNNQDDENMILKMDVEGAEWEVISELDESVMKRFSQMSFELHNILKNDHDRVLSVLEKIRKNFTPVWVHGNNHSFAESNDNKIIPNMIEITFVNNNRYSFDEIKGAMVFDDSPNCELIDDFDLSNWTII